MTDTAQDYLDRFNTDVLMIAIVGDQYQIYLGNGRYFCDKVSAIDVPLRCDNIRDKYIHWFLDRGYESLFSKISLLQYLYGDCLLTIKPGDVTVMAGSKCLILEPEKSLSDQIVLKGSNEIACSPCGPINISLDLTSYCNYVKDFSNLLYRDLDKVKNSYSFMKYLQDGSVWCAVHPEVDATNPYRECRNEVNDNSLTGDELLNKYIANVQMTNIQIEGSSAYISRYHYRTLLPLHDTTLAIPSSLPVSNIVVAYEKFVNSGRFVLTPEVGISCVFEEQGYELLPPRFPY